MWSEILFGVPQQSILGPVPCYIFLADLFLVVKDIDIASYADDSTSFIVEDDIENLIASLKELSESLFDWFKQQSFKDNPDISAVPWLVSTNT